MLFKAVPLQRLEENRILGVVIEKYHLALYLINGIVYATADQCTHSRCFFSKDGAIDGVEVACLCHGSRFIVASGLVVAPPAMRNVETYKTEVRDDFVFVEIPVDSE